jgi:hypothetical protein
MTLGLWLSTFKQCYSKLFCKILALFLNSIPIVFPYFCVPPMNGAVMKSKSLRLSQTFGASVIEFSEVLGS